MKPALRSHSKKLGVDPPLVRRVESGSEYHSIERLNHICVKERGAKPGGMPGLVQKDRTGRDQGLQQDYNKHYYCVVIVLVTMDHHRTAVLLDAP